MTDETLYPPRCCQRGMPWDEVKTKINGELATSFEKKQEELDTPIGQRIYCFDAKCSVFIGAENIANDVATCPACKKTTCTMCKETAHHEGDCPADEALDQTLTLASDRGWKRCGKCRRVIDLTFGCYHMICACRHEFCYACGADWKTCDCPQWRNEHLGVEDDDEEDED